MAGKQTVKNANTEKNIEIQSLADSITELADKLFAIDAEALAEDYADDNPRNMAVKGIDELRRGFYGPVTDRQDAQFVYVIGKLNDSEKLDHHNDQLKQKEREIVSQVKKKAYQLLHLVRGNSDDDKNADKA
jgi:hypothetical protein